jgi:hypothetical protein
MLRSHQWYALFAHRFSLSRALPLHRALCLVRSRILILPVNMVCLPVWVALGTVVARWGRGLSSTICECTLALNFIILCVAACCLRIG